MEERKKLHKYYKTELFSLSVDTYLGQFWKYQADILLHDLVGLLGRLVDLYFFHGFAG